MRHCVRAAIETHVASGARIAVALSGGRDSTALLDAAQVAATSLRREVVALHVHHGLSPHADAWSAHCASLCALRNVPISVEHIEVARAPRKSLEGTAREARYRALAAMAKQLGAAAVLLAHHQDDQAETLLLHLLRGSGPRGLAAMPRVRDARGVRWLRPLLDLPRSVIDAYVDAQGLTYVEDESNATDAHRRNALRRSVVPALRELDAGYPATLARAADLQAEAARLLQDIARDDAASYFDGATLDCRALRDLPPHRASNVLRWFLDTRGLAPPSHARLATMLRQLTNPRDDSSVCVQHCGVDIGVYHGRVMVHARAIASFRYEWTQGDSLVLPHGTLRLVAAQGGELDVTRLFAAPVSVRSRSGGERIALHAPERPRALKSILREAALPPWERRALPLVFSGDALAAVPRIGVDAAFRASDNGAQLVWHPAEDATLDIDATASIKRAPG